MPIDPNTGQFLASYPPPNPNNDPYFKEERAYPAGVFLPGGKINPNLIQMLAGMGAEMDPQGAGGIIGRAAIQHSRQTAAQEAYTDQFKDWRDNNTKLFDILSGWGQISPKGTAGPTSVQANPDGSINLKGDLTDQPQQPQGEIKQEPLQQETTPTGDPINPIKFKMAPLGPAMPREQLEAIPVPAPAAGTNRIKPGPMYTPGTEDEPEPIPKITTTAPRASTAPVSPPPQVVMPPPPAIPQVPATQPAQPVQPLIAGGSPPAPPNIAGLVPTPRRRSQTIFDLRDIVPF